jgi:uncharacterized iron-regulated membrane protein
MQEQVAKKPAKWQFLPPPFVRAMLAGHSALGIAFAALIYIVCLSGTLSVFIGELQRWEQPDAPVVGATPSPEAVDAAVDAAYRAAVADNAAHDLFIMGPGNGHERFFVSYHDHDTGKEGEWLADSAGTLVVRSHVPWSEFIANLHMHLHLPRTWGFFLVGLTGVALLSSLISGLLSHPRIFKDAFALRWGGSYRLQEADLHNRLGVWGLPFHVVVSTTGALLGLSTLIVGVLAMAAYNGDSEKAFATILGPRATESETPAPVPDVAAMIRTIEAQHPGAEFSSANFQNIGKAGQVVHLGMRTPGHLAMANTYYFDGAGKLLGDGGLETGGIGQQILGALQPLHFGWFGGLPVKLAYGVLGLALTIVTHSGIAIWLARRRDAGRALPGWEKVWAAVTWGQPLAFGTTALAIFTFGEKAALAAYIATIAIALLLAALPVSNWRMLSRLLQGLTALTALAAVAVNAYRWMGRHDDPASIWVSVAFVLAALLVLVIALRGSILPRHARS